MNDDVRIVVVYDSKLEMLRKWCGVAKGAREVNGVETETRRPCDPTAIVSDG